MTALPRVTAMALALLAATPAVARTGWDCAFEGYGANPARYELHIERRGSELVEPHWPAALAYRVLVDSRDILVAAHAYAMPPSFRRDARGTAYVLIINKQDGHAQRSVVTSGADDEVMEGNCRRF